MINDCLGNKTHLGGFDFVGKNIKDETLKLKDEIVSTECFFSSSADGPGGRRLTSTAWSPRLASFLTLTLPGSTGPSSGPWLGCTKRPTRACRNTCALLPPCAEGCAAYHPKREVRNQLSLSVSLYLSTLHYSTLCEAVWKLISVIFRLKQSPQRN